MEIRGHAVGVCSWSLDPRDVDELIGRARALGLQHVQLALGPLLELDAATRDAEIARLRESGLKLTSGMISFPGEDYATIASIRGTGGYVPDEHWPARKELTLRAADLAQTLGLNMMSTHVGFIPPSSDEKYDVMVKRACDVAAPLQDKGIDLLLETGQESASELLQFLNDLRCRGVYVNFDPANMILYGSGDPIEAIGILGRHIRHVHVKDAVMSEQPRMKWGDEVPFGTGQVPPRAFLDALDRARYAGPLVIERESGSDRSRDVLTAVNALRAAAGAA
jgi:sugar phosphate isomerase/epimerase